MLRSYIDCSTDEKYLTLGLWGKPVFTYAVQAAIESGCFGEIYIVTNSMYIEYLVRELSISVQVVEQKNDDGVIVDGRAAIVTANTIQKIVAAQREKDYCLNDYVENAAEKVIVESPLSFELALALIRKNERKIWLRDAVRKRITEKQSILNTAGKHEICLLGHSQFDQWDVQNLCGALIRNCGISGITIKEYFSDILENGLLDLSSEKIIVLLGTNDIVLNETLDEIFEDYCGLVDYICAKTASEIILLECIHVSGRLDRDNGQINELNKRIRNHYAGKVKTVDMSEMDDQFGNLNYRYTVDGLHLNKDGYLKLKEILEHVMR